MALSEKQAKALQSQYAFWSKKELEAIASEDTEALTNASKQKEAVEAKAVAGGVALEEVEVEEVAAVAKPANGGAKVPKSVKESAAVAEKAKKLAAAKASGGTTAAGKAKTPRVKKEKVLQPCLDGCGEMVGGNFKMGHDAKLKSLILKIERGEVAQTELPEIAQGIVAFKKGELSVEKDAKGKEKSRTQTYICTKAPVKFNGRPEIALTERE